MVIVQKPIQGKFGNLRPSDSSGKNVAIIISGVVVAAIVVALLLYFLVFKENAPAKNLTENSVVTRQPEEIKLGDITNLLENETFKGLKTYTELPGTSSPRGRDNPFLTY